MTFRVEVNNVHLPILARGFDYTGAPGDFKAFVEQYIIKKLKDVAKHGASLERLDAINAALDTDIIPAEV